jgi:hypothetical protein
MDSPEARTLAERIAARYGVAVERVQKYEVKLNDEAEVYANDNNGG